MNKDKMIRMMAENGYEWCGDGPCFIGMDDNENKMFFTWREVKDFIEFNFN